MKGEPGGVLDLGEAAHITGAAPGGKRYDASLTPRSRATSLGSQGRNLSASESESELEQKGYELLAV